MAEYDADTVKKLLEREVRISDNRFDMLFKKTDRMTKQFYAQVVLDVFLVGYIAYLMGVLHA